jgi:D-3-phosphoglycerate dehydrogenase
VDGIDVEAPLEQNLVYMRNRDVPGVVGKIGSILGEHKINIANFSLGRRQGTATSENPLEAVAVVHVDSPASQAVLAELAKIPAVQQAKSIRL